MTSSGADCLYHDRDVPSVIRDGSKLAGVVFGNVITPLGIRSGILPVLLLVAGSGKAPIEMKLPGPWPSPAKLGGVRREVVPYPGHNHVC